jgi:hypothetical protein
MGRKAREERQERREDIVAKRSQAKRKTTLMAAGILALIAVIVGYASFVFVTQVDSSSVPGGPPNAGKLGDEHVHSSLLVRIFGDKFDFAVPSYQIKNSWIHFEDSDGTTIHRHATGVTLGYLFDSLNIGIDSQCFVFPDGRQFCTNEDYSLKYYVNHQPVSDIRDYIFGDGDRILISFGPETPEEIEEQLLELDSQIIKG